MSKAILRGFVTQLGGDYLVEGERFCGLTIIEHGQAYLIGMPLEQLRHVELYSHVQVTIERVETVAPDAHPLTQVPPNQDDAADAKRYRHLRDSPHFNRDKCRLEWYLPRYFAGDGSRGSRLDQAIDSEIKQRGGG